MAKFVVLRYASCTYLCIVINYKRISRTAGK